MPHLPLTWSRNGLPDLTDNDGTALPILAAGGRHRARCTVAQAGYLVIEVASPRPLRLTSDGLLGLDEPMSWLSFQRCLRAALIIPVRAGAVELDFDFGSRPRHDAYVDAHCPSRNRAATLAKVAERFPDALSLRITAHPGDAPAVGLRFPPGQFHRDGVTWQEVVVRPVPGAAGPPRCDLRSLADQALPNLVLSTAEMPGPHHEASEPEELRAGLRRIYVAVGKLDAYPPLRQAGIDPRPEPEIEIAGKATLVVAGTAGSATVPMPVYETLGRLAPQRSYRAQAWPTAESLLAKLPEPIVDPSEAHLLRLWNEAWSMLLRLARPGQPESGLPGPFIATGSNFATSLFVWDTSFTALATAYGWRHLPTTSPLDNLWSRQHDGGYIHREHDRRDGVPVLFEPDFGPNPPLLAVAELAIARLSGDLARLRAIYPAACAHHRWLIANRRLADGTFWTTGLANGLDNSPSLGNGGYPCLTAQMAQHAETLAEIADLIGEEAAAWRSEHATITTALNTHLWEPRQGFYCTGLAAGGHNQAKVVTGFWPLWAGAVPAERISRLAEHLRDPASFWRQHPIPSLAADAPAYEPSGRYWLGSVWAPTNVAAIKGFWRAGHHELARETCHRHLRAMAEVLDSTGKLWENYAADAATAGGIAAPDYCWTATPPVALLMEVILGLEADAPRRRLRWTPQPGKRCGVRNLPLGPATVGLMQRANRHGTEIECYSDLPIELELVLPSGTRTIRLCGHQRVTC